MGVWIETKIILSFASVETVTPYVGVWIETCDIFTYQPQDVSHPTWVCGLKHNHKQRQNHLKHVTPYVGVWIETILLNQEKYRRLVTPYVGVWIETAFIDKKGEKLRVTPYVGVWIETCKLLDMLGYGCHTLRGCVD